jgi:hypothetical protein
MSDTRGFVYWSLLTSKTQAVLSSEVESRYSRLADTSTEEIASECPEKFLECSQKRWPISNY